MVFYPESAVERAMKIQEVILRAMAKRITWCQAAEIIGITDRQMRRWYQRYQEFGANAGPSIRPCLCRAIAISETRAYIWRCMNASAP
jgi:transposase-like protein